MWEVLVTALSPQWLLPPPVCGIRKPWEPDDTIPWGLHLPQGGAAVTQSCHQAQMHWYNRQKRSDNWSELHEAGEGSSTVLSGETEAQREGHTARWWGLFLLIHN